MCHVSTVLLKGSSFVVVGIFSLERTHETFPWSSLFCRRFVFEFSLSVSLSLSVTCRFETHRFETHNSVARTNLPVHSHPFLTLLLNVPTTTLRDGHIPPTVETTHEFTHPVLVRERQDLFTTSRESMHW